MRHINPNPRRGSPSAKPGRDAGPSQRQLRAGELVRHALAQVLLEDEVADPALIGASITVTEVRMSPDLKHAVCFVEPLGGEKAGEAVAGLNRAAKFLRGRLGRHVELKFTPDLKFLHDQSFDEAARMGRLFANPVVQRDLARTDRPDVADEDPVGEDPVGEDDGRR